MSMILACSSRLLFPAASFTKSPISYFARGLRTKQLIFEQFGEPENVIKCIESDLPALQDGQVLVRMLAAPVNPADCNTIQGKYPVKVVLPSLAGNEGVGEVLETKGAIGITPGKKVIITKPQLGTWRTNGVFDSVNLKVIPDELGLVEAATLQVNPCTAYRMLTDFRPVRQDGLVIIQNGANSSCGQAVIQLCKAWNICNVNIVRDRSDIYELKKYLLDLGATNVLTEEELRITKLFKDKVVDNPSLALNCVGGKSSLELLRHLKHSGAMVTYGGMSREPVTVPTSAFIFKNISCHGYWMTAWNENASQVKKDKMMEDLISLMCEKKLKAPAHEIVKFKNYRMALASALSVKGFTGKKYILEFSE